MTNKRIASLARHAANLRSVIRAEAKITGHPLDSLTLRQLAMRSLYAVQRGEIYSILAALRPPYSVRDEKTDALWIINVTKVSDPLGICYWVRYFAAVEGLRLEDITRIRVTRTETELFFDGQGTPSLLIDGVALGSRDTEERTCVARLLRSFTGAQACAADLHGAHIVNAQRLGSNWFLCVMSGGQLKNIA